MKLKKILEKIKSNGEAFDGHLPHSQIRNNGKYVLLNGGFWTDGFYIGIFHLAYLLSKDTKFLELSKRYDDFLELRIKNTDEINDANGFMKLDHDVGFIFLPTAGFYYQQFADEKAKEMLIAAADVLVERYNEKGGFIRAWDTWKEDRDEAFIEEKKGKVIIDSMMNLSLLFQVATITGKTHYYEIANTHAMNLAKYIVREDGSTFHTFNFNYITGEPIEGKTRQGYSNESCWSRGQAWTIYGFALAYKYTKNPIFLETSCKTADYFMSHLSSVDMPCWDFAACNEIFAPWDSSASAICASGLLELWELTGDVQFREHALRLLKALDTFCLTTEYENCQPLLLHGCVGTAYAKGNESQLIVPFVDTPLVYGDYFYLECLLKLSECKIRIF